MFMAVFARVRMWKQPKCPSVNVIVNTHTHTHTPAYTQSGILLNHKKRMAFCHLQQLGWMLRVLCLVK